MSISLLYAPSVRVGGEVLRGEVLLRFPQIIQDDVEEVHVKLRGKIYVKITRTRSNTTTNSMDSRSHNQSIEVARQNVSVWRKGAAYPPSDSNVLKVPFQLQLPLDVPPSCQYSGNRTKASISYFIEVVGVRPGLFSSNRRVMRPFAVVPADPVGVAIRALLQAGWIGGACNTLHRTSFMRKGIWGKYSTAKFELTMPAIQTFPLFTKVPFTLCITTTSKERRYEERHKVQEVFPEPPRSPKAVTLSLRRGVHLNANGWKASDSEIIGYVGGMGRSAPHLGHSDVVTTFEKKWVPSPKGHNLGTWKQVTTMDSTIELRCTPSFETPILRQYNSLHLKVAFPGIGNDMVFDIPLEVRSGLVAPAVQSEAPPYDGPPAALDLPPAYWAATDWDDAEVRV